MLSSFEFLTNNMRRERAKEQNEDVTRKTKKRLQYDNVPPSRTEGDHKNGNGSVG